MWVASRTGSENRVWTGTGFAEGPLCQDQGGWLYSVNKENWRRDFEQGNRISLIITHLRYAGRWVKETNLEDWSPIIKPLQQFMQGKENRRGRIV